MTAETLSFMIGRKSGEEPDAKEEKMETATQKCNGCHEQFNPDMGALSRYDNKTKICSSCGTSEAIVQFSAARYNLDPKSVLEAPGIAHWEAIANHILIHGEGGQS